MWYADNADHFDCFFHSYEKNPKFSNSSYNFKKILSYKISNFFNFFCKFSLFIFHGRINISFVWIGNKVTLEIFSTLKVDSMFGG